MNVEYKNFGKSKDGQDIILYTLSSEKGIKASVTNYGAILVNLWVPDKNGQIDDIVLGFDKVEDYFSNPSFFGSTIGPSANRIAKAQFSLDGAEICLDANDGANNLHSHRELGYHKRVWKAEILEQGVKFSLEDADGSMGFPGKKQFEVTYKLEENCLTIYYHAISDKKTILNPTNHTYFNLEGHQAGSIEEHKVCLKASHYTPIDAGLIPTGEIASVEGTPMDFTQPKQVGQEITAEFEQLRLAGGYDHNWVIDGWDGTLRQFAVVTAPKSNRQMKVSTTLPGVQFYTGNFISNQQGKQGAVYQKRSGLCLETQYFPDSIHHAAFPACVFGGDKEYNSVTQFCFE